MGSRVSFRHPRYRIVRLLGEGGMGRVYLARDLLEEGPGGAGREVALKVYPGRSGDDRLRNEFLALRELRHPGIARALSFGVSTEDGAPFFTLEYIAGEPIDERLDPGSDEAPGVRTARMALGVRLFTAVAAAAAYMHRRGILHLDIKPGNILVVDVAPGWAPRPVLIDFGLVRPATTSGAPVGHGTLPFAPPEVFTGDAPGPASDVYSLGATFYKVFSGRYPVDCRDAAAAARAHRTSAPPPLPECPAALARVILRALAKDPSHRFRDAGDLHRALLRPPVASLAEGMAPPSAVLFHEPHFAGRSRALEAARAWLEGDRREAPILEVEGEGGMGKTRFLERMETLIETRGKSVLTLRAAGPHGPPLLASCTRALDVLSPDSAPARRESARALHALEKAAHARRAGVPRSMLPAEASRLLARRALLRLLPLLRAGAFLLIDDLHLAGEADQAFVLDAARALASLPQPPAGGLVAALRPAAVGSEPLLARGTVIHPPADPLRGLSRRIRLGPFDIDEALEVDLEGLDGALSRFSPEKARRLKEALHRQTEGHPLFYVRGLLDLAGDPEAAVRLAPTERVLSQVGRLDRPARDAIAVLATLGRPVASADLAGMLEVTPAAAARTLERLRMAGMVATGGRAARILHESIEKAVAGSLSAAERRASHERISAHLRRAEERPALAEAAWHAFEAGDAAAGLSLATRSIQGGLPLPSALPDRILGALSRAAEKAGPGTAAGSRLLEAASDVLEGLGRYEECLAAREQLLGPSRDGARTSASAPAEARIHRKLGSVAHRAGRIDLALEHLARCIDRSAGAAAPLESLRGRAELALLHHFRGETHKALEHSRGGLDVWKRLDPRQRKEAIQSAVDLHGILGQIRIRELKFGEAIDLLREGLRLAKETGSRSNLSLLLNNLALANHLAGRFGLALATFRRAEAIAEDLGDAAALISIRLNIAQILAKKGRFVDAGELLDEVEQAPAVSQSRRLRLVGLYTRGLLLSLLRSGAEEVWSRVEASGGEVDDAFLVRFARVYRAEERILRGDLSGARRILADDSGGEDDPVTRAMRAARRSFLEALLGHAAEAQRLRKEASSGPETPGLIAAWNDYYTGASALETGRHSEGARRLEAARKVFRATGFAAGEIESALALADLHLRARPRGRSALRAAEREIRAALAVPADAPANASPRAREPRAAVLEARLHLARRSLAGTAPGKLDGLIAKAAADPALSLEPEARITLDIVSAAAARLAGSRDRAAEAAQRAEDARREVARGLDPSDAESYLARDPWERLGLEEFRPPGGSPRLEPRQAEALASIIEALASSQDPLLPERGADGPRVPLAGRVLASIAEGTEADRVEVVAGDDVLSSWGPVPKKGARGTVRLEAPAMFRGAIIAVLRVAAPPSRGFTASADAFLAAAAGALAPYLFRESKEGAGAEETASLERTGAIRPRPIPGTSAIGGGRRPSTEAIERLLEREGIIVGGREMRKAIRAARALAPSEIPVLITGESGTGKNIIARLLHRLGPRGDGPFVTQNAAALPPELFEADLFGHEEGAFTGADRSRTGYLFQAGGGTFHLEEVGDLDLQLQKRLLRVIEEKTVRPLGATRSRALDVRFVASTQRDIDSMARRGEFRKDLFFRLDGARIHLPPLRQRLDELPALAQHAWRELAGPGEKLPAHVISLLLDHDWPGNIRELGSVLRRLRLEGTGTPKTADVRASLGPRAPARLFPPAIFDHRGFGDVLRALEESHLEHLHEKHGGDLSKIAAALGTTTRSVYRRFERLGLRPGELGKKKG